MKQGKYHKIVSASILLSGTWSSAHTAFEMYLVDSDLYNESATDSVTGDNITAQLSGWANTSAAMRPVTVVVAVPTMNSFPITSLHSSGIVLTATKAAPSTPLITMVQKNLYYSCLISPLC